MRRKKKEPPRPTIEPQHWEGESALGRVHLFNERGLALMADQEDDALGALWRQVDARALKRAARCPVLLVDLYFHRPDQWLRILQKRGTPEATSAPMPAALLLKEILLEARTLGRSMPRALNLLFGMASEVTDIILKLTASDIDRIALDEARHLKARWPESRNFWKRLLEAAIGTDDQELARVHLHCLQLLGSEAIQS